MRVLLLTTCLLICTAGCDIFQTKSDDLGGFTLSAHYDGRPIYDTLHIDLTWNNVEIEYFDSLYVQRQNVTTSTESWTTVFTFADSLTHSYSDTISDDATFKYRVIITDVDHNTISAESTIDIARTTTLTVPTNFETIDGAVLSAIIDDGDTVLVLPGEYVVSSLQYASKHISLIGVEGPKNTIMSFQRLDKSMGSQQDRGAILDKSSTVSPYVDINGGLFQGFTVIYVSGAGAGALQVTGGGMLRQLIVAQSFSYPGDPGEPGDGGGIYVKGAATIQNCVIAGNTAFGQGGGIFIAKAALDVIIINSTIISNQSLGRGTGLAVLGRGEVSIENSIFYNNTVYIDSVFPSMNYNSFDMRSINSAAFTGIEWGGALVHLDTTNFSFSDINGTNISAEAPLVSTIMGDYYMLLPGSPAIDAGNPDPAYNDVDGSRNDMGAHGGPYGDW